MVYEQWLLLHPAHKATGFHLKEQKLEWANLILASFADPRWGGGGNEVQLRTGLGAVAYLVNGQAGLCTCAGFPQSPPQLSQSISSWLGHGQEAGWQTT